MSQRGVMAKCADYWRTLSPAELRLFAGLCFVVSFAWPCLKVGVDWAAGWQAAFMAAKDAIPLVFGVDHGNYVCACAAGTAANLLFIFSWPLGWLPRVCVALCVIVVLLMLYVPMALTDSGLLGGVHVGYLLWLAGPVLMGVASVRRRKRKLQMRRADEQSPQVA